MPNAVVRIERRIESDRNAGGFGIAHRAHGIAPRASLSHAKRGDRQRNERERQICDAVLADLGPEHARARNAGQAVPAAGETLPFGRALLDDEAEGDGHHREIGPAHPQRRNRKQDAGQSGDEAAHAQAPARTTIQSAVVRMPTA